jgi:hypothetical protein
MVLAAAVAAACTGGAETAPACPRVAIVTAAGTLTRFAPGAGRDLLDVEYRAEIADLITACKDEEKAGKPVATVVLAPVIVADRGPANRDRQVGLRYFVSVVDADQRILQKASYDVPVEFSQNRDRVVIRDDDPPIVVAVPNAKGEAARGYEVLVGFQLTPDDLDYNQQQGGRFGSTLPGARSGEPNW